MKIYKESLKRNKCQLILANGSERGEFVPLDYVFSQFKRIHDGVQLVKTYYPGDDSWNPHKRISTVSKKEGVSFAWGYEYEDYHPFDVFESESTTLDQMEQIKLYGSDINLTLTLDLSLSNEELERICKVLNKLGRIYLRINHECNGSWFRYNIQHSYKEVSDFFVRFHKIIKSNTSEVYTVFSLSADCSVREEVVLDEHLHLSDKELKEALKVADYWSISKYSSLHYGWPFNKVVPGTNENYFGGTTDEWWRHVEETYLKMIWNNDLEMKPLFINEFNADADVDGDESQANVISSVYNRLVKGDFDWLEGIVLYQFRDEGGLGLERGNLKKYEQLPSLKAYTKAMGEFKYELDVDENEWEREDYIFNWRDSDSIKGLKINKIEGKNKFINKFGLPLFVVEEKEQKWTRLEVNGKYFLEGIFEIHIFLPPFKMKNGNTCFSKVVRGIKDKLEEMFE